MHGYTDEKSAHAWNYLYHPNDKKWYLVDVTWDNHKAIGKATTYSYFLVGNNTQIKYSNGTSFVSENHIPERKIYPIQTYIPLTPELAEEAYVKFSGTMKKSPTTKTNGYVTVTSTFNKQLSKYPNGWTISEDKKTISKTYEDNVDEKVTVINEIGERLTGTISITNIDKTEPEATVSYSSSNITNHNVEVKIIANEQLQEVEGWTLSEDKKTMTKNYLENKSEIIEIKDIAGNIKQVPIEVKNIDKTKPYLVILYEGINEQISNGVVVTITGNEELQGIEGWDLSEDKKTLYKTYTQNTSEELEIKDIPGNVRNVKLSITSINNENTDYIVKYSTEEMYNKNVETKITANRELKPKEGWTLSEDKKTLTRIYTEDISEELEIEDIDGNVEKIKINTNYNTNEELETYVTYSNKNITKNDIQVTITANKQLQELDGWTLSEDKKSLVKTYTINTNETITVKDINGNEKSVIIEINNIDKILPKLQVQYSDNNKDGEVMVIITSDKELAEKENWMLSEDKKTITRIYTESIEDDILIEDLSGNEQTVKIQITDTQLKPIEEQELTGDIEEIAGINDINEEKNEDKEENKADKNNTDDKEQNSETMNNDNKEIDSIVEIEDAKGQKVVKQPEQEEQKTESKLILPYTGNYLNVFVIVAIVACIGVISYRRYKTIDR